MSSSGQWSWEDRKERMESLKIPDDELNSVLGFTADNLVSSDRAFSRKIKTLSGHRRAIPSRAVPMT